MVRVGPVRYYCLAQNMRDVCSSPTRVSELADLMRFRSRVAVASNALLITAVCERKGRSTRAWEAAAA